MGGAAVAVRVYPVDIELGWNLARGLNTVLLQPHYKVEEVGAAVGRIAPESRGAQSQLSDAVISLLQDSDACIPDGFRPLQVVALPELAVPDGKVESLTKAVSSARPGTLLVAGIERMSRERYAELLSVTEGDDEWRDAEVATLSRQDDHVRNWVNVLLIAWRDAAGDAGATFQRKVTASRWERATLCCGEGVRVMRTSGATFAFFVCSDMTDAPDADALPAAQWIAEYLRNADDGCSLAAVFHMQRNPRPDNDLILRSYRRLIADDGQPGGALLGNGIVLRANAAGARADSSDFACSGVVLDCAHRPSPEPQPCCHRREVGSFRCHELRAREGSAFLLKARFPSHITYEQALMGMEPLDGARWLDIRRLRDQINFCSPDAAEPDGYRFAAMAVFSDQLTGLGGQDLLAPFGGGDAEERERLGLELQSSYRSLREACRGGNGECLRRWGEELHGLVARSRRPDPDSWEAQGHRARLRHLVAGLAMIHWHLPLEPGSDAGRSALRLASGQAGLHCRHALGLLWSNVVGGIRQYAEAEHVGFPDVFLVHEAGGEPKPTWVPLGGFASPGGPNYALQRADGPPSLGEACVLVVPVSAIESRVLESDAGDVGAMRQGLAELLAGT